MIIRVVRMTFKENEVDSFLSTFDKNKANIRAFDGCEHLELLKDANQVNIYTTYSFWKSEEHLNAYRDSRLFSEVWTETKKLFSDKPSAHSYHQVEKLN